MPIASVNGIDVYYEIEGSGPRLMVISGTGGDLRKQPNIFTSPLTKHFEMLAYDQRGLGRTSKPDSPYTMETYASDAAALLDAVGWSSAHVLGISFGGMVAQELAIREPERVGRLVLACTSPGGEGGASYPLHELIEMDPIERAKHLIPISDNRHDTAWATANPETYETLVQMSLDPFADEPGRAEGARRQLEARADHNTFARLDRITAPTLIAAGTYDCIARPEAQEAMAQRIPQAELKFFDGGHLFMLQDRSAFPAMIEFLGSGAAAQVA